jgi:hypothetical protein
MTAERERQLFRHRGQCAQGAEIEASEKVAPLIEELYD